MSMKFSTIKLLVTGLVLIIIHQCTLQIVNSILLMELMGLGTFCYLRYRYIKNKGYTRDKANHFLDNRYNRPKVYKPWRDYRSTIEVNPKTWVDHHEESLKQ
jgi:hypothetical protein